MALIGENGNRKNNNFSRLFVVKRILHQEIFFYEKGIKIGYLKQVPDEYKSKSVRDVFNVILCTFRCTQRATDRFRS